MQPATRVKQIILAIGDVLILYISLALTLIIRYQQMPSAEIINLHLRPFTILFFFWILVFYIVGLYELRRLKNNLDFFKNFGTALVISAIISVIFFYLITNYGITPKTNLLIFIVVVLILEYIWRSAYNNFIGQQLPQTKVLLVGKSETTKQLLNLIKQNPQYGYNPDVCNEIEEIVSVVPGRRIEMIAIEPELKQNPRVAAIVYKYLTAGVEVLDTATLYENILGKVPVAELEEYWFLETILHRRRLYDFFRLPLEIILAFALAVVLSPLLILIALLIKLTSAGPILIKQKRTGELG